MFIGISLEGFGAVSVYTGLLSDSAYFFAVLGSFVPQSVLPDSVLGAAKFLPAYWYVRVNNMLGGFGKEVFDMEFYWLCIGIQLMFTVAIFAVTMVFSKQRRSQHS